MPFRLIGIFAFPLEQFFLTRDFSIFSSSSSSSSFFFFIFFFLSHRPSALRKRRKGLIFTPNISTGHGGVHRHQAIVSFLLYDTTTKSRGFNFTSLNDAILQLPRLSVYALCGYIQRWSHVLLPVALSVFATFGCLNCIFAKLWCSNAAYISQWISLQNKFLSSFLSGAATCCSHYFMSWISHFLIYLWVYFVLTKFSILAQPENAANRQIYMIIITNNKGCIQTVLLNLAW